MCVCWCIGLEFGVILSINLLLHKGFVGDIFRRNVVCSCKHFFSALCYISRVGRGNLGTCRLPTLLYAGHSVKLKINIFRGAGVQGCDCNTTFVSSITSHFNIFIYWEKAQR